MRTTIDVPEHLLVEAKKLAAMRRTTLTAILEESLRAYLAEVKRRPLRRLRSPLHVNRISRVAPGIDLNDTSRLLELE